MQQKSNIHKTWTHVEFFSGSYGLYFIHGFIARCNSSYWIRLYKSLGFSILFYNFFGIHLDFLNFFVNYQFYAGMIFFLIISQFVPEPELPAMQFERQHDVRFFILLLVSQ